ncbi:MAG: hypothetical protein JNL21_03165 [Myxococcales bacterium]|nr:hypothetical protein [Myxococcales bacterium]
MRARDGLFHKGARSLLAAVFVVVLALLLVIEQAGRALSSPEKLERILAEAGLVDHLYDAVLPAALADATAAGVPLFSAPDVPRLTVDAADHRAVVAALATVVSPGELEHDLAGALATAGAYVTGKRDDLAFDVALGDRAKKLPNAAIALADAVRLEDRLAADAVLPRVDALARSVVADATGFVLSDEEIQVIARELVPRVWLRARLVEVAEGLARYLAGDDDGLPVHIDLRGSVDHAATALHDHLWLRQRPRRVFRDRFLDPYLEDHFAALELPAGVRLSRPALRAVVMRSMPRRWTMETTRAVLAVFTDYIEGRRDDVAVEISLAGRKPRLALALADAWLEELLRGLPICEPVEVPKAALALAAPARPSCAPAHDGLVWALIRARARARAEPMVGSLPDSIRLSDAETRARLGASASATLDAARARIGAGVVIDQAALTNITGGPGSTGATLLALLRGRPPFDEPPRPLRLARTAFGWRWLAYALTIAALATHVMLSRAGARARLERCAALIVGALSLALATAGLALLFLPSRLDLTGALQAQPQLSSALSEPAVRAALRSAGVAFWIDGASILGAPLAVLSFALLASRLAGWLERRINRRSSQTSRTGR